MVLPGSTASFAHPTDPSFDDKANACWPQILPWRAVQRSISLGAGFHKDSQGIWRMTKTPFCKQNRMMYIDVPWRSINWSMNHHGPIIAFQCSLLEVSVLPPQLLDAAGIKWLEMFTGLDSKVEVKSATRSRSPTSGSSDAKWSVVKRWILLQACHRSQNVFET